MVPRTKEELRKLVSETTVEMYEEMTPQLIKLIDETKHNENLTEAQKQDEIVRHPKSKRLPSATEKGRQIPPGQHTPPQAEGQADIAVAIKASDDAHQKEGSKHSPCIPRAGCAQSWK